MSISKSTEINLVQTIKGSLFAFITYTCMYGFRKPFTVATYEPYLFLGMSYKVSMIIAQVIGYATSKWIGIKFISELNREKRKFYILLLIGCAWLSLLLFSLTPRPFNLIFMFLNGLPLGLIYGLVMSYLEGRRVSEVLGATLGVSIIFASGFAKSVGKWALTNFDVSAWSMPAFVGLFYALPLLFAVHFLNKMKPPNEFDELNRSPRAKMNNALRKDFLKEYKWILIPVVIAYTLFTITRDFVEDFAFEWLKENNVENAGVFSLTSTWVALIVLLVLMSFVFIKSNKKAFMSSHYIVFVGIFLMVLGVFLFKTNNIKIVSWVTISLLGVYLCYLPFNCLYFERMISTHRIKGNIGFVIYFADAFGYLGTIMVLVLKEFFIGTMNWTSFFSIFLLVIGLTAAVLIGIAFQQNRNKINLSVNIKN